MLLAPRCNYMLPNHCQCPNPVVKNPENLDGTKTYKPFYLECCLLHDKLVNASNTPAPEQVNEQIQGDRAVDKQENGKEA